MRSLSGVLFSSKTGVPMHTEAVGSGRRRGESFTITSVSTVRREGKTKVCLGAVLFRSSDPEPGAHRSVVSCRVGFFGADMMSTVAVLGPD